MTKWAESGFPVPIEKDQNHKGFLSPSEGSQASSDEGLHLSVSFFAHSYPSVCLKLTISTPSR